MIKLWASLMTRPLSWASMCWVGRTTKMEITNQNNRSQVASSMRSNRSRSSMLGKIFLYCKEKNKQAMDDLYNRQFYNNINNSNYLLVEIYPYKNTTDFYFRDYISLVMDLQNQEIFAKYSNLKYDPDMIFMKKCMVYMLSDHSKLEKLIKASQKNPTTSPSFHVVNLTALSHLVLGNFPIAEGLLLAIINASMDDLFGRPLRGEKRTVPSSMMALEDKVMPNILNLRQQMLFNMLICKMYTSTENQQQKTSNKNTAMNLHNKIVKKQKIVSSDLQLIDYQSFLNIWLSAKYDTIIDWADLNEQQKQPYFNYIYLLAESAYINKDRQNSIRILTKLPQDYPLRIFMQMSMLYDDKNFPELVKKYEKIWDLIDTKNARYFKYPEYDVVVLNAMKIMKKMHRFNKQQGEADAMECQIAIFKNDHNLREVQGKGIQSYYLNIPFQQFIVHDSLVKLFDFQNKMFQDK